jgi:hypothetical protein
MSSLKTGSICLTDLLEKAKAGHSAFTKGTNGKVYANIKIWLNDEADKYGNDVGIQLNSTKEKKDVEGSVYIGNAKSPKSNEPAAVQVDDLGSLDDLPF